MEEVFRHLLHHEAKIMEEEEAMEGITFEAMEVATEAVELVSLSYCRYLALVAVVFLVF